MKIEGKATHSGTLRYQKRFQDQLPASHFRLNQGWACSSIGLGTYLGSFDEDTDRRYEEAILQAASLGCNVFDTAINYRCMRSEHSLGRALKRAVESGFGRDEFVVCTKGGFVPFDGAPPDDLEEYLHAEYLDPGRIPPGQLVAGCHSLAPSFLQDQLERSLENLALESVDVYFLHNPETQLQEVSREELRHRLRSAFERLESLVEAGRIHLYGVATWNGLRARPESREFLSLAQLLQWAREVAGEGHHFRALQLPYNLLMPEAFTSADQPLPEQQGTSSVLEVARRQNLLVLTSASICQGRLAGRLPDRLAEAFPGLESDVQRAIQFARSTPGVTTALVGMSNPCHVRENLRTAGQPPLSQDLIFQLFE